MDKEKNEDLQKINKKELDTVLTKILSVPPPNKKKSRKKKKKH
jgi:hypothetical protein